MKLSRLALAAFAAFSGAFGLASAVPHTALAQELRVIVAPPPLRFEVPGPRPGPYHVWRSGIWLWHADGRYIWHPGHWVMPPEGHTVWVKDEWVSFAGAWRFVPGHWRAVGDPIPTALQRVVVTVAPPADQVETIALVPEGHAWIPGHWSWDGARYVWVPGQHMAVPEGFHTWTPGHWYAGGGHWFYASGYWR